MSTVAEDIRSAVERIESQAGEPHPCQLGQHVVHPKALHSPGWYVCGSCAALVEVTIPLAELMVA